MKNAIRRFVVWTPRVLGLLFAAFISVFALDVFGAGYGFWEAVAALLIHLVPTYLILIALAVAWRWEWVGAALFVGLGVWYLVMAWGQFPWATYLVISGPAFLIGGLFLANAVWPAEQRSSPGPSLEG